MSRNSMSSRGVWGHAPPRKIWIVDSLRLILMQPGSKICNHIFDFCFTVYTINYIRSYSYPMH